jgi:hypothetical protein
MRRAMIFPLVKNDAFGSVAFLARLEHGPDADHVYIVDVNTGHSRRVSLVVHLALEYSCMITAIT